MCRRFYTEMKSRGRGVIVNVPGVAEEKMDRTYIARSTGNAALMAFTKAPGDSAGDDNLRVFGRGSSSHQWLPRPPRRSYRV
jgi:hypothetical protein